MLDSSGVRSRQLFITRDNSFLLVFTNECCGMATMSYPGRIDISLIIARNRRLRRFRVTAPPTRRLTA